MSPFAYQISAIAQCAACIYLIACGRRAGLLRAYPFFYAYLVITSFGILVQEFILIPLTYDPYPRIYSAFYFGRGILAVLLAAIVVWRIYRLPHRLGREGDRRMVGPWVAMAVALLAMVAMEEIHVYYRVGAGLLGFVEVLGVAAVFRLQGSNGLQAGKNVTAILVGLTFYHGLGAVDHFLVYARSWWDFGSFQAALQPLAYLRWGFFIWGLRVADPPEALQPVDQEAVRAALRARLKAAAKGLKSS